MFRVTWLLSYPPKIGYWIQDLEFADDIEHILANPAIKCAPLKLEEVPENYPNINGWLDEEIPGDI